jgi:hypothetical protein
MRGLRIASREAQRSFGAKYGHKEGIAAAFCNHALSGKFGTERTLPNRTLASGRAFLLASALIHEALEFFAIPSVAKIVHKFGKLPLGCGKPLVLFLEPRKFACAPFVKSTISG